jgi:multidrug efflux pump subunit AcrA (membrane-fusion protein)
VRWRAALIAGAVVVAAGVPIAAAPYWWKPTAVVVDGPVADRIIARAVVVPVDGVAGVAGPADGRVIKVLVREGDRVAAGDTLAEIEGAAGSTGPSRITAPVAGAVIARRIEPGDSVGPATQGGTQPLFEIADPSRSEVRAEIEERDAGRVAKGQLVAITTPGARSVLGRGKVGRVGETIERRTIGVEDGRVRAAGSVRSAWITWDGAAPVVQLGQHLEAELELPEKPAAARLPRTAVVVRDGRTVVDVRYLLWSREVAVEVDAADGGFAEIRGVAPGTRVFLH